MKATYPTPLPNTTQLVLLSCCCLVCPCERLNSLFSVYFGSMVLTHQAVVHRCKRLPVRGQGHRTPAPSFLKISPASSIFLLSGLPTHSFSASSPMELVSKHPGFQSGLLTMLNEMSYRTVSCLSDSTEMAMQRRRSPSRCDSECSNCSPLCRTSSLLLGAHGKLAKHTEILE